MSLSFGAKNKLFFNSSDSEAYQKNYENIFKKKTEDRAPDYVAHGRKVYIYGKKSVESEERITNKHFANFLVEQAERSYELDES